MFQHPSDPCSTEFADFETFLRTEGYHLNVSPEDAKERMLSQFSPKSMQRFERLMEIRKERPYRAEELYSVIETLQEAALLFSPAANVLSACGEQLSRTLKPLLTPGVRVADMGCGVGSWTRWMAEHHPNVTVVGFDGHNGLLNIASEAASPSNCQFVECEYRDLSQAYGRYAVVASLLGIDFEPGVFSPNSATLSPEDPSQTDLTRYFQQTFSTAVSGWKRVLEPDGVLAIVLRLPNFESWYGCLLGARSEGLRFDPLRSSCIAVGKQRYPLLVFQFSNDSSPVDVDDALEWWTDRTGGAAGDSQVALDAAALLRYRRLKNRQIIEDTDTHYEDGHFMRKETGFADGVGYVYEYATTQYRRLECIPVDRLKDSQRPTYLASEGEMILT